MTPGRAAVLANYKEYVSLVEWEAMKADLKHEAIPVKRNSLLDYVPAALVQHPSSSQELNAEAQVFHESQAREDQHQRPAARFYVEPDRPASPRHLAAVQRWRETREASEDAVPASARGTSSRQLGDRSSPSVVGRMCIGLESPRLEGLAAEVAVASPKVETVSAASVGLEFMRKSLERRVVSDKDRASYPRGKALKPLRENNIQQRQRLTAALSAANRVDATFAHPSRSFGLVPSANLRVA